MRTHMDRVFEVPATPDQVWPFVADLRRVLARTEPQTTVSMEGGDKPVKQGAKFHLTTKSGLKSDWTIQTFIPPKQISQRIDLGVWDGGISTVTLEPIEGGTRVTLRTPTMPWPQTWAPVRYGTWPLVLRDAKRTGERFERAVRAHVAELGAPAAE